MTNQSWETKAAKRLKKAARILHTQALAVVRKEAAIRTNDDDGTQCALLHISPPIFCASDTRLLSNGESDGDWKKVYACMCEACLSVEEE